MLVTEEIEQLQAEPIADLTGEQPKEQFVDELGAGAAAVAHARPFSRSRARASRTSSASRAASACATRSPKRVMR